MSIHLIAASKIATDPNNGLSQLARHLLFVLAAHGNKRLNDDFVWPSQETLAAAMKCCDRSVRRALAELVKADLVRKEARFNEQGRTSDLIELILPLARGEFGPDGGWVPD